MTNQEEKAKKLAEFCAKEAEEKKAADIVTLHVSELTTVADYFVLMTAQSEPQMKALAGWLQKQAWEQLKIKPLTVNGESASQWVLIDFGAVFVHIMTQEMREKYQLETLWGDAPKLEDLEKLKKMENSSSKK